MIVVNGENIRIFTIIILSVVWFYLLNQHLRENESNNWYAIHNNLVFFISVCHTFNNERMESYERGSITRL